MVPFTRERNCSTSFRIGPKSGTLRSDGNTCDTKKVERYAVVPFLSEQANGKHVNGTIAFPSDHKTKLVRYRSIPM